MNTIRRIGVTLCVAGCFIAANISANADTAIEISNVKATKAQLVKIQEKLGQSAAGDVIFSMTPDGKIKGEIHFIPNTPGRTTFVENTIYRKVYLAEKMAKEMAANP